MTTQNPYESPEADVSAIPSEHASHQNRRLIWLLFSFRGRLPRRAFWGVYVVGVAVLHTISVLDGMAAAALPDQADLFAFLVLAPDAVWVWIFLAILVKRWHDRDKSGWWVLIVCIPIAGEIWTYLEAGGARGTVGPNRFGEDCTGDGRLESMLQLRSRLRSVG